MLVHLLLSSSLKVSLELRHLVVIITIHIIHVLLRRLCFRLLILANCVLRGATERERVCVCVCAHE